MNLLEAKHPLALQYFIIFAALLDLLAFNYYLHFLFNHALTLLSIIHKNQSLIYKDFKFIYVFKCVRLY